MCTRREWLYPPACLGDITKTQPKESLPNRSFLSAENSFIADAAGSKDEAHWSPPWRFRLALPTGLRLVRQNLLGLAAMMSLSFDCPHGGRRTSAETIYVNGRDVLCKECGKPISLTDGEFFGKLLSALLVVALGLALWGTLRILSYRDSADPRIPMNPPPAWRPEEKEPSPSAPQPLPRSCDLLAFIGLMRDSPSRRPARPGPRHHRGRGSEGCVDRRKTASM